MTLYKMLPMMMILSILQGCGGRFEKGCEIPSEYKNKSISTIIKESREILRQPGEKKAIAYSIYGNKALYVQGVLKDIDIAKEFYPSWQVVIYAHSTTVPKEIIDQARAKGAIVLDDPSYDHPSTRFFIADMDYDRFIVRDADSRLLYREMAAVADWIKKDWAILHGMREATIHTNPMLAGMWGARTKGLRAKLLERWGSESLGELYKKFASEKDKAYGDDELFLKTIVLPAVGEDNFLAHESVYCHAFKNSTGFPIRRSILPGYIGQKIED